MTFNKIMNQMLFDRGMLGPQIDEVLEAYVDSNESMAGRMDDDTSGYPKVMLNVIWVGVKSEALKWIDKNCPQAFYRSMFA